jgi:hypothetical protein
MAGTFDLVAASRCLLEACGSENSPASSASAPGPSGITTGEFLGLAATGRSVEYVSHEFYRIAGGLIAEEWICSDMATLFRQLS